MVNSQHGRLLAWITIDTQAERTHQTLKLDGNGTRPAQTRQLLHGERHYVRFSRVGMHHRKVRRVSMPNRLFPGVMARQVFAERPAR